MMEPEVRYCVSSGGVRIAYTVTGTGDPHVVLADPAGSHVQLEWSHGGMLQPFLTELARHNTLIRLDLRGSGLSDRVLPGSLDDWVSDLEAVVDRLGIQAFALTAIVSGAPVAIALGARHKDRIRRLAFINGFANGAQAAGMPQARALLALSDIDYTMATELIGAMAFGTGRDEARDQGGYTRACVGPEYLKFLPVLNQWDVSAECAAIQAPALVLHHRGLAFIGEDTARDLAARLPDARLVILDGMMADDVIGEATRIVAFINNRRIEDIAASPARSSATGTAVILFADLVDSTGLTEQLGDATFREQHRRLDERLRSVIRERNGTPVAGRTLGDGVLASFASARDAIAAALSLAATSTEFEMPLHLGIHAGDILREDENVWGGTVNIAARISGLSAPNEILVSATVRDLARSSAGVRFEDRGEHALKGIAEPQRVFAVRGA